MNQSTSPSASGASLLPDGIGIITTAHMIMIAIVAIIAVAIIVIGARRSARRKQARTEVVAHAREAGVADRGTQAPRLDDELVQSQRQSQTARPVRSEPAAPEPPPRTTSESMPAPGTTPESMPAPGTTSESTPAPAPLAGEPIAAGSALDANPAAIAADLPGDAPSPGDGPVTQLKGLGPKVATRLTELGVTTIGQIAALDDAQAASLDAELGPFAGRMARDRWIEQARFLAAGDRSGFERVFGRL